MNAADRLRMSLKGHGTDRPPCICPGGMMNMVTLEVQRAVSTMWPEAHQEPEAMARLARGVQLQTGIENLGVPFCMTVEAESLGAPINLGNQATEPHVSGYVLERMEEWEVLRPINPSAGRMSAVIEAAGLLARESGDLPVIANLTGPISLAASLIEPMTLYRAMGRKPETVHAFLGWLAEGLALYGAALMEAGATILCISEPSGSGEILGPRRFAQFAAPYINQILDSLDQSCSASMVHICGRLNSVFQELDTLHTQAISIDSATSVSRMREAVPGKVIVGNVSTQLLQDGSPDRVKQAARGCIKRGAAVLSPACGMSLLTPTVNLRAMAEAAAECRGDAADLQE